MKKLQRTLSLPGAIAVSVGGMLSGIFVLPGLAVGITGSSVWLAFLVSALCILPAVLSKSELATSMPISGGTYVYTYSFITLAGTEIAYPVTLEMSNVILVIGVLLIVCSLGSFLASKTSLKIKL